MVQMRMEGFKKVHEDLERVIEKDDSSSSVSGSEDGKGQPPSFRQKLVHIIHSTKFQVAIICLVVIDCILVISELIIDLEMVGNHEHSVVPEVLHYMSIAILSIFMVELMVKLYAMGLSFFKHKMEVFDAVIVVLSFALDVAFTNESSGSTATSLLIVLRLWRIVRILNGIVMSVKVQAERKIAREKKLREALDQELSKYRQYCSDQEREIEALQALLRSNNIEFEKNEKPVMGSTLSVVAEVNNPSDKGTGLQEVDLAGPLA